MAKLEDLRKIKDQASKAIEKQKYAKAAELYLEIAEREPDPDWHQRAGEAFRRAGDGAQAITALTVAADGYAQAGFLLKAIAVCKAILQVDPKQTAMQSKLAELYARRDGGPGKAAAERAAPPMLHPPAAPAAPAMLHPPAAPVAVQPPSAHAPIAAPPVYSTADAGPSVSSTIDTGPPGFTTDEADGPALPALFPKTAPRAPIPIEPEAINAIAIARADAPMDALPLRRVLGGRRSEQIAVADVIAIAQSEAPGAYEISLDDEDLSIELDTPPTPPAPSVELTVEQTTEPIMRIDEETDFGGLDDEPAPPPRAAPVPPPPRAAPAAPLPKIPLFSSLGEADLRFFIERMTMSTHAAGEVIVKKGDPGGSLYVLVDGQADVLVEAAPIAQLGPGAFFGEVGVLTDEPRTATIAASAPCTVLTVSRELLWDLVRRSPEVLKTLLRFLRDRLLERLLGTSPLFAGMSPEDAQGLAAQFVFLEIEPGFAAVQQGQRSPGLFFMLCGAAEAVRDGAVLGRLGPGDVFGERSLLLRAPANADVRALRKCWVLELPQARFQEIMVTYPQVLAYVSEVNEARTAVPAAKASDRAGDRRVDLV